MRRAGAATALMVSAVLTAAEVVLFTGVHASDPGSASADSGTELVRAMQHKIADLG